MAASSWSSHERQESVPVNPSGIPVYKGWRNPDVFTTLRRFGLGSPIEPLVQPSQSRMRKDVTGGYGASSSVWRSLPESEMCAVLVVVANILREPAFQVAFVNCDDVIQEIMPATPYPTLCDSILPRTFERSAERFRPQGSNRCGTLQSILGINQR
jgi:hypothetical protein